MEQLIPVNSTNDIPLQYQDTPIGKLLEYHNLEISHDTYDKAQLLVGMCMDNRKFLNIPDNFAFIIRSGGGNLRYSEFKVSYAVAVGGVKYIALIGHTNCGMVNVAARKNNFIKGLVDNAGWTRDKAEEHFNHFAPMFEIENETDFALNEAIRLRKRYPKVTITPLLYRVEDNKLNFIKEN